MMNRNRREFLADIGKGMLVASVGPALVAELGLMPALAGDTSERLTFGPMEPLDTHEGHAAAEALRDLMRKDDRANAERLLAARAEKSLDEAYNELLLCVQDEVDVHRVVLAWRAWATLDLTGRDVALTLLRQSIHFCCDSEHDRIAKKRGESGVRKVLPEMLDKYRLLSKSPGNRKADDA